MHEPWKELTEEDIIRLKADGSGCLTFILTVFSSVLLTLLTLQILGYITIF